MRIRAADESDLQSVRVCLAAAFEPYRAVYTAGEFSDTVPDDAALTARFQRMRLLVAESPDHGVVGTVAHEVGEPGIGHLRGMAVLPVHLGTGIAARLLDSAERELQAAGCARVTLDTTEPLQRAIHFYERHGYRPTGRVTDFFGMPLFEYAKDLLRKQ